MNAPRQTYRVGTCLAAGFAVPWSWRSTFPLFGPGTITPRQAVAHTAPLAEFMQHPWPVQNRRLLYEFWNGEF